jgi:hypothetical protein
VARAPKYRRAPSAAGFRSTGKGQISFTRSREGFSTMQQRVLLGAGVAVVALAAFFLFRTSGNHVTPQAVDKNIDQIVATLPPGYAATHGATDTNALTGSVTLHDFKLTYGGRLLWSADELSFSGGDQHALSDVFDPGAYPQGHPAWTQRRLLIGDASASGVHIPSQGDAGPTAFIKSVTLHHLSGRPFMLPPTRAHLREPAMQADMALAFAFDSFDQHDLVASDAPPKNSKAKLGDLSVRHYDGGRIGSASLRDMSVDIDTGRPGEAISHATLDSIDIKNVDLAASLEKQRQSAVADRYAFGTMSYDSFDLAGLNIDISPGPRISLHDVTGRFPLAGSDSVRAGDFTLTGLTLALKDTKVPPSAAAALDAFGMNSLTIDMAVKSHGNEADKHTDFTEDLDLKNLGMLHVAADITGYDAVAARADAKGALMATTLNHATIVWQDAGLVDRSFNAAATTMHSTAAVVRAELAVPLLTLGMMIPDQPDATDQVSAFLNHPGTLTITMNPPQKITFGEIAQASTQEKAHLLGVHIQAKAP